MSWDTVARPYAAAFILLRRDDGQYAFLLRTHTDFMDNHYGAPAGKVEKGESFVQAIVRETQEEVGVTIRPEDVRPVLVCYRRAEDSTESWVDVFFETTHWDGTPHNAEPHKHGELKWFALDNLPDNVIPYYHDVVRHLQAGDHFFEYGW